MSSTSIRIAYEGDAIDNGTMDVRDLAPALLAIGHLCERSNEALYGESSQVVVRVAADFKKGSFVINLLLDHNIQQQVMELLCGNLVQSALNLIEILGLTATGAVGVLKFIKWVAGRKFKSVTELADGNVKIEIQSESVIISKNVLNLFLNTTVRNEAYNILKPLERDGINAFKVIGEKNEEVYFTEDLKYFVPPESDKFLLIDDKRQQAFTIVSLSFKEENKWRLSDGQNTISARIVDEEFILKVSQHDLEFGSGDSLLCEVRVEQWQTAKGLQTEYTIEKVIKLVKAARQIALPLEKP